MENKWLSLLIASLLIGGLLASWSSARRLHFGTISAIDEKIDELKKKKAEEERKKTESQEIYVADIDTTTIVTDPTTGLKMASNRVIVHFKEGISRPTIEETVSKCNTKIVGQIPNLNVYQLEILDGSSPNGKVATLSNDPNIELAGPNFLTEIGPFGTLHAKKLRAPYKPNEGGYVLGEEYKAIDIFEAWDITKGNADIKIGVVDSGVRVSHEDLREKVADQFRPYGDLNGHGTAVAGVAAAGFDNSKGIAGIGGHTKILSIKVDDVIVGGIIDFFTAAAGIDWVVNKGAKIINMSFGNPFEIYYRISGLRKVVQRSYEKNIVLVAAAGNEGKNIGTNSYWPASDPKVIAVAGTTFWYGEETLPTQTIDGWSTNFSSNTVAAPTGFVTTGNKYDDDYWSGFEGTSAAAPVVSGLAALILSVKPNATPSEVKDIIFQTCDTLYNADGSTMTYPNSNIPVRRINAYKAVLAARGNNAPSKPSTPSGPSSGNTGVSYSFSVSAADPEGDDVAIRFYWGDGSTSTWSSYVKSGTTISSSHVYTSTGTFYVKAQARDEHYDITKTTSIWSDGKAIVIARGNSPPHTPSNPSPANGATNQPVNVILSWTGGDPDAGDTVTYTVYLEANNPTPSVSVSVNQSSATLSLTTLSPNTTYYWQVIAQDGHGAITAGSIWRFITSGWYYEVVDSSGNVGKCTKIAVDQKGYLYIGYLEAEKEGYIKYAKYNGSSWTVKSTGIFLWNQPARRYVSMVFDSALDLHISYPYRWAGGVDSIEFYGALGYAKLDDVLLDTQTVHYVADVNYEYIGEPTSIAVDTNSYAHICYFYSRYKSYPQYTWFRETRYARWTGSSWKVQTIESKATNEVGECFSSIAVDSVGQIHICYSTYEGQLKYNAQIVDYVGTWQVHSSMCVDSNNDPHISYCVGGRLKYVKWTGVSWSTQTVDLNGDVGEFNSLALDSNGYPFISYYDSTSRDLKCARWNGLAWDIEVVDSVGDVGQFSSIALDSNGNPHISYYDATNGDLKYATWAP